MAAAIEEEFTKARDAITAADLTDLIPVIESFGLGSDLDVVIRTARPGAKVQRRFMPARVQADILRAALVRNPKAQEVVQDAVIGLYADHLGDDVTDPTLEQLRSTTDTVLGGTSEALVKFALLGVVARHEVAEPHAVVVLRERFGCDLAG